MSEDFSQNIAPTAAIRAILGSYPFSIGLFREILQNSDDAGATKQVFLLDRRVHGTRSVFNPRLDVVQGAALLAFNNGTVTDDDWKALRSIHQSSKVADTSKIGKYGIGFRSCYHITDVPQILSGFYLAMMDPSQELLENGGVKLDIPAELQEGPDHLSDHLMAFDPFLRRSDWGKTPFPGTIFRLPLRTSASQLSDKPISADEILDLLKTFAKEELDISLLFLRNITSIEIFEIGANGKKASIGSASVRRTPPEACGKCNIQKAIIKTSDMTKSLDGREWRILHSSFSDVEATKALSQRVGGDHTKTLSRHKLSPNVELAIPLNAPNSTKIGRLFTYLPLPLHTEFPIHINALFALTQSRQNLRNGGEVGVVPGSDDDVLIKWNQLLFDTYIPQAWTTLLQVLVKNDKIKNIFDAWPSLQAGVQSGDYMYWRDIPLHVAQHALGFSVWPVFGSDPLAYQTATRLLIAEGPIDDNTLNTLVRTGVLVTRPPQYLARLLTQSSSDIKLLSPESAHNELQHLITRIEKLDDSSVLTILTYLLSTSNCRYIVGLPLIRSVTGVRMALSPNESYSLLDEAEEDLFATYDDKAISLKHLPKNIREILLNHGPGVLSVAQLDPLRVAAYLKSSPYASQFQSAATTNQIRWLDKFWDWVQSWSSDFTFCNGYHLVPTIKGSKRPIDLVFDPQGDKVVTGILDLLHISVIDPRLSTRASGALKHLHPSSDIHTLLRALPSPINVEFSETQAKHLRGYLLKYLPLSYSQHNATSADGELRSRLRSLPIYPVIYPSADGTLLTRRGSIAISPIARGVNRSEVPILPQMDSITYIDIQTINHEILQYLNTQHLAPLSVSEMQDLMLEHLSAQSLEIQTAFLRYLNSNASKVPRGVLDRLAGIKFVPASDGTLQMPKDLVDPQTPIAALFPRPSPSIPGTSSKILSTLASQLQKLKLFMTELSTEIIRDRIECITQGHCSDPKNLARTLINLITDKDFDCRDLFRPPGQAGLTLDLQWIPTSRGMKSPNQCRDSSSHSGKTYLFDEVLAVVMPDVRIGPSLRRAFTWEGEVTFDIISQQLVNILDGLKPRGTERYDRVYKIVEELGLRSTTPSQFSSLRHSLQGRNWVPTRQGTLVATPYALLGGEDLPETGFYSTEFHSRQHSKVREFLKEMGCVERPSKHAILDRLQSLSKSDCRKTTESIVRLLSWLPPLTPGERTNLFIPDSRGALCHFTKVYYNDIGSRAALLDTTSITMAHPRITPELASNLGLRRLGLMNIDGQFDEDMGEDLVTTIRNRLREYSTSQLLLEFFANAADAGATEFNILIDEYTAPSEALLSPRCSEFQCVPALIIHNNVVFTDEDFKGIRRTGIGGKAGRRDTIGQFGLGALTMFHITELAMIVSRDQVLFLNPCKAHLSFDRVAVQLPLSTVRKSYSDHLTPLLGMFGFDLPRDNAMDYSYEGTIFRLPLRSSEQLRDVKPISEKVPSLRDIVSNFRLIAAECLLFTSMTSIHCYKRLPDVPKNKSLLWSTTGTQCDISVLKEHISARTVTICTPECQKGQEWRILTLRVAESQLPPLIDSLKEQYRLQLPSTVQLGACLSSSPCRHNLFSTLPLPIPLDLPVHISGSFILASDRRSIRLDEYENTETNYNRWLLTTVIPMLYLHFLEDRASSSDNAVYWPGNTEVFSRDTSDIISRTITDATYHMAAKTDTSIFRSKFHPLSLPPCETHLIEPYQPHAVAIVLETLKARGVVQLPPSVIRRLVKVADRRISLVSPGYVHAQMLDSPVQFYPSILDFEELQDLISFLIRTRTKDSDPSRFLIGLPLLPLGDQKTVVKFDHPSDSCFYVVPPEVVQVNLFERHRLVDIRLDTASLLQPSIKLNLERITDANIGNLLNNHVSPSQVLEGADLKTETWIETFWKVFPSLGVTKSAIIDYPLVQTSGVKHFVSLSNCQSPSIILADFRYQEWLSRCLTQMGFVTVNTASLPTQLQDILDPKPTLMSVDEVLSVLLDHFQRRSISTLFDSLDSDLREQLVSWIYNGFCYKTKNYFLEHHNYQRLPIWRSVSNTFVPADEAMMLPQDVDFNTLIPFSPSNKVVNYDPILKIMGVQPSPSILPLIDMPTLLERHLDEAYNVLLDALLRTTRKGDSIPIPNSRRVIQQSNTLYSSRGDLFLAAFGRKSERFIHPSLRHLENELEQFGLKRQNDLNIDIFRSCVEAFQNSIGGDIRGRGATIFKIFCEDLPVQVDANQEYQWKSLDNLRFIPHDTSPRPLGSVDVSPFISRHLRFLTDLASPERLVRREFLPIAWSQRALYNTEPHQRVLVAYPNLSVPTAEEVVNHLTVLATEVAPDHPRNLILVDHLKQTYTWLNDHTEEAEKFLRRCTDDRIPLFLNVDDPAQEEWNWKRGDHILLDEYDKYDIGHLESPRDFLKAFRPLLVVAGAVPINYKEELENTDQQPTTDGYLTQVSAGLNQMRRNRICTDVSFVCNPPDGEPIFAHRAFLAACSNYFNRMFSGESLEANPAQPIPIPESSRRCIDYVLNCAYTGTIPEIKRDESELALNMISLMHNWTMVNGQRDMQRAMIKLKMVDLFNLDAVRAVARSTQSRELLDYCISYEKDNELVIQQAREYAAGSPQN